MLASIGNAKQSEEYVHYSLVNRNYENQKISCKSAYQADET